MIKAIEFAIANRRALDIDIINLSLGHVPYESAKTDPLVRAVDKASAAGIIVVVAAGNVGISPATGRSAYGGILSPGNARSAITVGAAHTMGTRTRNDDVIGPYSSRGPTWGDGYAKPDLVAPGHKLLAPVDGDSELPRKNPSLKSGSAERPDLPHADGHEHGRRRDLRRRGARARGQWRRVLPATSSELTPNAIKAILQYSALPMRDAIGHRLRPHDPGRRRAERRRRHAARASDRHLLAQPLLAGLRRGARQLHRRARSHGRSSSSGATTSSGATASSRRLAAWDENVIWGDSIAWENVIWGDNIVWGDSAGLEEQHRVGREPGLG